MKIVCNVCKEITMFFKFNYDFLIDANLGKLARHLRFYGISIYFSRESNHFSLEKIAVETKIKVITTAQTHKFEECCLKIPVEIRSDLIEQLKFVSLNYQINDYFNLEKTRCGLCNTLLRKLDGKEKFEKIPLRTKQLILEFKQSENVWFCSHCTKYYWEGSHWENIKNKIRNL